MIVVFILCDHTLAHNWGSPYVTLPSLVFVKCRVLELFSICAVFVLSLGVMHFWISYHFEFLIIYNIIGFPGISMGLFSEHVPCLEHDHEILRPVIVSTWMPEKVGGLLGKSLVFAESQVNFPLRNSFMYNAYKMKIARLSEK